MMKFFNRNQIEIAASGAGNSIAASTGAGVANIYDRNFATIWSSVGSDDTTTETIEVIWAVARTIDSISLMTHNFKEFTIQYWNGSAYVDFSTPISETANTAANSYYSFNSVSTLKVKISVVKTIVANAQKTLGEFLAYATYFTLTDADASTPDADNPQPYYKEFEHEKANGGCVLVAEAMLPKYQNIFSFNNLLETYVNYITALKNLFVSFWIMPNTDNPQYQYYVNMLRPQFRMIAAWSTTTGERASQGSFEVKET
jgi:hypothetical protein